MADEPFRLRLLKAITGALETITIENGYQHDMAGKVFRGRLTFGDSDPLPMISVLEPPLPEDVLWAMADNTYSTGPMQLLIQGFVDDDFHNPTDPAHRLMADVKLCLAREKKRQASMGKANMLGMGGAVMEMQIGQGACRPPDYASDRGFFWLTLTLRLVEDLDNPYGG